MFSYFLCNSSNNSLDSQLSQQVTEAGTPTILPTITFPNKPSKSYQCTQGSRQSKATSGDLCAGEFLCPGALRGLWLAKGHVMARGGCRECWEKKIFLKGWQLPTTNMDTEHRRITNWGVSVLQRGDWDREKPCFLCVWAQSVSVVRSAGDSWMLQIRTPQPATVLHTYWKADSCIHPSR